MDLEGWSEQFGLPVRSHGLVHVGCLMVDSSDLEQGFICK